jgi:hypothetical protein
VAAPVLHVAEWVAFLAGTPLFGQLLQAVLEAVAPRHLTSLSQATLGFARDRHEH